MAPQSRWLGRLNRPWTTKKPCERGESGKNPTIFTKPWDYKRLLFGGMRPQDDGSPKQHYYDYGLATYFQPGTTYCSDITTPTPRSTHSTTSPNRHSSIAAPSSLRLSTFQRIPAMDLSTADQETEQEPPAASSSSSSFSSSSPKDMDWYSDDCYSSDWCRNDWHINANKTSSTTAATATAETAPADTTTYSRD